MDAYTLSLKLRMDGFDEALAKLNSVDATGKKVAASTGASFSRIATRATGIGSAIAAAGEVGVSAMQRLVTSATNVAFTFGAGGAIVGAAGIAAIAIVTIFQRARKEMEETDKKARALLKGLAFDTGAAKMTELFSGDVGAVPGTPAALGLQRARARREELQAQVTAAGTRADRFGEITSLAPAAAISELKDLNKWILENGKAYDQVKAKVETLTQVEIDRARLVVEEGDKERAKTAAKLGLTRAMGVAGEALHAADAMIEVITDQVNLRVAEFTPTVEKLLQESVMKGLSELPSGTGEGIAGAGLGLQRSGMLSAFAEQAEALAKQMRETVTSVFGDAITEGFAAAFSGRGIGGAFKALGRTILSGLGQIFMSMGQKMVAASAIMESFQKAIMGFFPGGGLVAGLALMALGGAMMGAGGRAGGTGGGTAGSGYGGGGYNNTQESITRVRLMPGWAGEGAGVSQRSQNNYQLTIIGANDPKAQREIKALFNNAERRGL